MMSKKLEQMMTSPKLSKEQVKFLDEYLDSLDYSKIDSKELIRELMTTQVLRDPDSQHGGKYDIFCGHNRTLAYATVKAETNLHYGSGGILQIFHTESKKRMN